MSEHRPITRDYVSLSLRAGYLAATADRFLRDSTFITFLHFHSWDLTAQMILELQSAAMSLGVPVSIILTNDAIVADLLADEGNVQALLQAQADRDEQMKRRPQDARPA